MRRARNEQGVVAVMMALIITVVMIPIAALAVDIGMQRVARRDMQSLADVVALDLARQLDGTTSAAVLLSAFNGPSGLAAQSAARNMDTVGDNDTRTVVAQVGTIDPTKYGTSGYFTPMAGGAVPSAVRVTASTEVGFGLARALPGGGVASGSASRSAVATAAPSACFKIGSYELGVASNKSALNGLLGNALDIGALGYDGLATSSITLLGLAANLGVGTPDALVHMPDLTLGALVKASSEVLAQQSPLAANVTLLNTIKTKLDAAGTSGTAIDLAKLINIGTGDNSGLDATVNLLDLVSGAAFLANGSAAIDVPSLGLSLSGVGSINAKLKVIEPPKLGCNGGSASTGQVQLTLDGNLSAGVPLVLTVNGPIHVDLGLAIATGKLNTVTCANGAPKSISVDVTQKQAAATTLLLGNPTSTPQKWLAVKAVLGILTVPLANVGVRTAQPNTTGSYTLDPWVDYVSSPYHTPQTPTSLPSFTANAGLLGLPLGGLLNPLVNSVLNPLVTSLNGLVADVLAPALGLKVAGVDLFSVKTPTCAGPKLVG